MSSRLVVFLIRGYQIMLSPVLGGHCRFDPTCSEYARQSVAEYGVSYGAWLAIRRVLRCHPLCQGGYDPVPTANE